MCKRETHETKERTSIAHRSLTHSAIHAERDTNIRRERGMQRDTQTETYSDTVQERATQKGTQTRSHNSEIQTDRERGRAMS